MAQGKMKVKSKLPKGAKTKKQNGNAVTKWPNAPVPSKSVADRNKMKSAVTKMVNAAAAEQQLRDLETNTPQLSAAQQKVAKVPTAPVPAAAKY